MEPAGDHFEAAVAQAAETGERGTVAARLSALLHVPRGEKLRSFGAEQPAPPGRPQAPRCRGRGPSPDYVSSSTRREQ